MNIWGFCVDLEYFLGGDYVVHNYESIGMIQVCRVKEVWDSPDGSDITLASFNAEVLNNVEKMAKNIIKEFDAYDRGLYPNMETVDVYQYKYKGVN